MAQGPKAASSPPAAAENGGLCSPKYSSKLEVRQPEEASSSSSSSPSPPPLPPSPLPRFTRFTSLPPEIRYMIYDLVLPADVPELYILQADKIPPTITTTTTTTTTTTNGTDTDTGTTRPGAAKDAPPHPTVYTAYPVLMHVSREARRELDLDIVAQVLVEYQRPPGEDGPCWVEKGRDSATNLVSGMAWDLGIR
ncbi:hypothetical protein F4809DRAFT_654685 [Biscogniauxia mediterranea]|nr:hypothetical protein F4809DRAFT_654685 [Biscogniauxia mediterranea]